MTMKKILSKITLAGLAVALLGSCSKINERLDNLEKRVDGIESEEIASIESQIAGIQSSISCLDQVRSDIYELQTAGAVQGTELAMLEESYESLGIRIDELKAQAESLVPGYATKEWVEATFSTLEQYETTCDTIAKIDARIGGLDAKLSKDIKACADSLKRWVNTKLDAYYTAAEAGAKLGLMQSNLDLTGEITEAAAAAADSLAAEFAKVRTLIDAVKAELKAEYKTAVEKAITESKGRITPQIAAAVEKAGEGVPALVEKVNDLQSQVDGLKRRVEALKGRIQSVTIVPAYGDGSVKVDNDSLYLTCIIKPATAVAGLDTTNFGILPKEVTRTTKGKLADTIKVRKDDLVIDGTTGTVSMKADVKDYIDKLGNDTFLAVALHVQTSVTSYTTDYVKVKFILPPAGALKGRFSVSATKKVYFSKGNLTYNVTTKNWAFYEHQYDCAAGYEAELISLFTWGYDANKSILPSGKQYLSGHGDDGESFSKSEDWGYVFGGESSVWRTLTKDEWTYLFKTRTVNGGTGEGKSYQRATINSDATGGGIYGMILYPNNYSETGKTSYTSAEWVSLENAGCVFLPAASMRDVSTVSDVGKYGYYWSSTSNSNTAAYDVYFWEDIVELGNRGNRGWGFSVRLVTDVPAMK